MSYPVYLEAIHLAGMPQHNGGYNKVVKYLRKTVIQLHLFITQLFSSKTLD